MTERQGTVDGQSEEAGTAPQWRVEGSESDAYGDGGLGDTVVRIPVITDDSPKPPARPRTRTGRTGNQPKVGADGHPVASASAPASQAPAAQPAPAQPKPPLDSPTVVTAPVAAAVAAPAPVLPPPPTFGPPQSFAEPTIAQPMAQPVKPAPSPAAAGAPASKASTLRRSRKARLRLAKVDPWSVMKTVFLFSIAFGIMFWVSVSVVWTVLVNSGLFDAINKQIVDLLSSPTSQATWRIEDYVNANKVLGITALLAVVNVVISTALGTLTAFLYNLSANILGGLELTLSED